MFIENISTLKIHKLTQEQYDREFAAGNIDENALYLVPDKGIDLSEYAKTSEVNAGLNSLYSAIAPITEIEIARMFADV